MIKLSGLPNSKAYPWALTGVFAALHLVITLIPFTLAFGGGQISFGMISAPLVGFLLGPFFGPIAALIGSIIAIFINAELAAIGPFTVLATASGALGAGLLRSRKPIGVPLIFLMSMAMYLVSPIGVLVPSFIWFHVVAFCLSLIFLVPSVSTTLLNGLEFKKESNLAISAIAIWMLSIIAVTLDQAVGSALGPYYFVYVLGADAAFIGGFFEFAIVLYAIERLIGSILLAALLFALGNILVNSNLGLPITSLTPFGYEELTEVEIAIEQ